MDNQKIAHDLAVAKLYGSELPTQELIKKYREYYSDILSTLNSEPKEPRKPNPVKISARII